MKRNWTLDELIDQFTFLPQELTLLGNKSGETRIGFAVLYKFFQNEARFPYKKTEVPKSVVEFIAKQIDIDPILFDQYQWDNRSATYHRKQIREYFEFRPFEQEELEQLIDWIQEELLSENIDLDWVKEQVLVKLRAIQMEPPTPDRLIRFLRSIIHQFEEKFFESTYSQLSIMSINRMNHLIHLWTETNDDVVSDEEALTFRELISDPGRVGVDTLMQEIQKLRSIQQLEIPLDLFKDVSPKILKKYRQRAISEDIRELRRHPEPIRYTLLSIFLWCRSREIIDNLVELLTQIIHKIGARAEKKVEKEMLQDLKKVNGKHALLFRMAEKALEYPEGIVREVLYPVVNEQTLEDLVKEMKHSGPVFRQKVYTMMRSSYSSHYRKMVPAILKAIEFRSNNDLHQPVIEALELLKKYAGTSYRFYEGTENIPILGVVKNALMDTVLDKEENRINRINYEICVLQTLRDKLRCKEVWIVGADRYRNPEEDLPSDFDTRRQEHYQALKQPLDAEEFVNTLRKRMTKALAQLDSGLSSNSKVKILTKGSGWISLSPLEPQTEPRHLSLIKNEIIKRWPMTSLLDMLKEADLQVGFTNLFKTVGTRETLDRETIQKRLILCLYGLGTNAGLKRLSAGDHGVNYKDLLYIRRKFIHKENLRLAISQVVNAILQHRIQDIWGEGTTSCASDSKKFGAWDQNLMTEWHIRYRGRGVMIYWHVEKNSTCVYSQLKSCSSSEVAAMMDGLLKHMTDMTIEKNYVDTHGQSEIAFAFCHLLNFQLMPRFKGIHKKKLYRPDIGMKDAFSNLTPILTRPIQWELIKQQYDQMVKYATALRLGTAETEAILKRFTKNNSHPTYRALAELGKAIKTIFLCEYLHSEEIRREIQEGLNVVENWNSANSFIFYGKGGEIQTNQLEDQEIAVLSLHLLQNSLVLINTLMIQEVLLENNKQLLQKLEPEDYRALTPLIYSHVNPYGTFQLNMNQRLPLRNITA
ncbi:Transposase and inactivated derivatives, TnpA family [Seinonella peptonophila]|uniref:Transposase and inactivated derivatives, TnpA family n=1 Tax=Seinonella peptonophila TaxID=112248 RepID=A0A1M4T7M4_9BACL|nr:Tn3 family transposase [Seinonella peptonophila]SHE40489.1 Transposase and inactivated derivatives, TnpA family [Seinonella peptonophila]